MPQSEKVTGPDRLVKLREPFPANQISKLPKESKAQADERKANRTAAISCAVCGGWHHRNAVHLDYVGHAALTDRLLDADVEWSWEPVAFAPDGLPAFDRTGGLWIKLTVCGVTRLGYGSADGKSGGDAVKEIIGDALRNAAMRFGAALDLWHKGTLHADDDGGGGDSGRGNAPAQAGNQTQQRQPTRSPAMAPESTVTDAEREEARKLMKMINLEIRRCESGDDVDLLLSDNIEDIERIRKVSEEGKMQILANADKQRAALMQKVAA